MTKKSDKSGQDQKWSNTTKAGVAAVGSAALVAALLYAGKRSKTQEKGKLEPLSPEPKGKPDTAKQPLADTD